MPDVGILIHTLDHYSVPVGMMAKSVAKALAIINAKPDMELVFKQCMFDRQALLFFSKN